MIMHGRTILGFILYDSTKQLWNQIELNSDFDCTLFLVVLVFYRKLPEKTRQL
jgi:hypothetical protein